MEEGTAKLVDNALWFKGAYFIFYYFYKMHLLTEYLDLLYLNNRSNRFILNNIKRFSLF